MGDCMKLLLVSGGMHQIITGYATKKIEIINSNGFELKDLHSFLDDVKPVFEGVLITDEAFSQRAEQDEKELTLLLEWLSMLPRTDVKVLILTRDFMKGTELRDLSKKYANLSFIICDLVRVSGSFYHQAFAEFLAEKKQVVKYAARPKESEKVEKKKSFFDRFRSKSQNETVPKATDHLTRQLEFISRGISRIVAITGHRGCGLTSTVVNLASEASKRGLSTIIIDLDIDYRSTNMYFSSFEEQTKRAEDINASLIRTLARPQDYVTTAFNIKDNLWITALGYEFNDLKLIGKFYNSNKLVGLLSVLRNKFNLVILDMPLDLCKVFKESLIHIDVFGLCVPNNLYAVLSTLRNVEVVLDEESAAYLNAKARVVVTKYNDRSRMQNEIFIPEKVNEVLASGLSDSFTYEMKLAGYVPYASNFDIQIETDVPLVNTSAVHEVAYGNILLRLMEGVK